MLFRLGSRIKNIVDELKGEKIDIIMKYFGGVIPETRLAGDHDAD